MDDAKRDDFLAQEYLLLQKTVEDFDARALTIKAWSVTFSAAGLGLAYQQGNPRFLLFAGLSALTFWLVEAVWKIHQRAYYSRIAQLEAHFSGEVTVVAPFQVTRTWFASHGGPDRVSRWLTIPFYPGVMLPHIVVAAAGGLLFALSPP